MTIPRTSSAQRPVRKNWRFSIAQAEALHGLLAMVAQPLGACAFVLPDGQALHVQPAGPADLATLPQAASICHRYLNLRNGDVALTNDPNSGGTTLSDFTLVAGVSLESPGGESDILITRRISLPARISAKPGLDAEGVRIPPMPLVAGGKVNSEILTAISAHPLAPQGLAEAVLESLEVIKVAAAALKNIAGESGSELRKSNFKNYFEDSSRAFEALMARLPLGAVSVSQKAPSGELIKLQLKLTEKTLHFDFGGTEASSVLALTEIATFSACMAATAFAIGKPFAMNAGTFGHLQISAPSRTLVSSHVQAQSAAGAWRGMTIGIALVCDLALTAFARLNPALKTSPGAGFHGLYQFEFSEGRVLSGRIAAGGGARADQDGIEAYARWAEQGTDLISIEKLENDFPISVLAAGTRSSSGGKGLKRGGDGTVFAVHCLEASLLRWILGPMIERRDGLEGGRAGQTAKIEVIRASGGERESFETAEGSVRLEAGDQAYVMSSGGSGFGTLSEAAEAKEAAKEAKKEAKEKSSSGRGL